MEFQDAALRSKLKNRIIAGISGSTKFDTYQGQPHELYEYMDNVDNDDPKFEDPIMKMYDKLNTIKMTRIINTGILILIIIVIALLYYKIK
jgi:hypothetical protein